MSDNICFPAKLAHGHIIDLIEKKVDRIFFPMVIYEHKEQKNSVNSFNCPIVSSYSEVLKSSIDPEGKYGIPLDSPTVTFNDEYLLKKASFLYLKKFGVSKSVFNEAFIKASAEKNKFLSDLKNKTYEILEKAHLKNRHVVLLAGRPYHTDPLVHQKTAQILTDLGVDVINEAIVYEEAGSVFDELLTVTQWSYPNRVLKAAQWVAAQKNMNLHFVQLNSFGCGPDAYLIDESMEILRSKGKNHTLIKIDDISSTGSVRLRLRSLIESLKLKDKNAQIIETPRKTTPAFTEKDRTKTIIGPWFSEFYSPFIPSLFGILGYKYENIPIGTPDSITEGLKYANNEICYPATLIVGDIINALKSGKYDLENTVVGITQTGGQCRATNYISLIKKAMVAAGFENVPVVSIATADGTINNQPGFKLDWKKVVKPLFYTLLFSDNLSKMYYATIPREIQKGTAARLRDKYLHLVQPLILNRNIDGVTNLLKQAVAEFNNVETHSKSVPKVGIVGEIYVKYNPFGNSQIVKWLQEQNVEVVVPPLLDFMIQGFVNVRVNKKANLDRTGSSIYTKILEFIANRTINKIEKIMSDFKYYIPYSSIYHEAEHAEKIIDLANQFGEGWLIPAEISTFAKNGVNHVVSLQPFGCIANHVISKGVEKKIKLSFPDMNLLFLDFDSGTSEVNIHNRLYFLVRNAKEHAEQKLSNLTVAAESGVLPITCVEQEIQS